ncbi:hypothetical protein Aasi_1426 [Candidatus Amoebophilus asiaticus 5a2]|uniref:SIMPL domain-containing protein n=1 Tax=Amoebophilus asiaticus (strain 5a2) TaxID=452471 RepID=B3EU15_AMOA5|nr:SIMPL domain-containing protein [Candidatus Amoebophilus asiaticus]ACE06717.1 hypothetical protein Aasi_1426 [Candidatus Amoebophilus asiaticus 5a2]
MNNTFDTRNYGLLKIMLLSLSFIISSAILGSYLLKSRQSQRSVTVRGLAERDVAANLGIWPVCFRVADDDLVILKQKIEKQRNVITEFLSKLGFKSTEITYGVPEIDDKEASNYRADRKLRYAAQLTITVRSDNVAGLEQALQKSEELVARGIVLDADRWEHRYKFIFTELNELKPAMIQQATLEARKAAEQFAKDSGSKVGNICHATQGLFSIEDTHIPTKKHIRVVTTVQYTLID